MNINILQIKKLNPLAMTPIRGSSKSAGYDLFSTEDFVLMPMKRHLFKTGLSISIPQGIYGRIAPRSGLAFKDGIDTLAGVIDCFSESSNIKTENGDKKVTDLKINEIIFSINENLEIERDFISAIVYLGEKEMLQIETDDGVLEITPGTLVYTETGIKKAEELKKDEKILHF